MSPPTMASTADSTGVPATESKAGDPPLLEHAYDGIREYDNPLPGWWRGLKFPRPQAVVERGTIAMSCNEEGTFPGPHLSRGFMGLTLNLILRVEG